MIRDIQGLHHVTAIAGDARTNNAFFTGTLGLRRVKKTVNFDAPDVYHLYYGDETGTPGSVMTCFPFPGARPGRAGSGAVSRTVFAVPEGALAFWRARLRACGVADLGEEIRFDTARLTFAGPDGERLALVETQGDARSPWTGADVPRDMAIRGFHSVELALGDTRATAELLEFMGYARHISEGDVTRYRMPGGNGADIVDLSRDTGPEERQGAGSVHHVAFSTPTRESQAAVRAALMEAGHQITPVIDRDYFEAIYFRSPGGVLFEVATDTPGFTRDEDAAALGEALKLPDQHAHLRARLENGILPPLEA